MQLDVVDLISFLLVLTCVYGRGTIFSKNLLGSPRKNMVTVSVLRVLLPCVLQIIRCIDEFVQAKHIDSFPEGHPWCW